MKEWIFRKFIQDGLLHEAYKRADAWLSARWPKGWPRALHAIRAWSLIGGTIAAGLGAGATWLAHTLQEGGMVDAAAHVVTLGGSVVVVFGVIHAIARWITYEEAHDADGFLDDESAEKPDFNSFRQPASPPPSSTGQKP